MSSANDDPCFIVWRGFIVGKKRLQIAIGKLKLERRQSNLNFQILAPRLAVASGANIHDCFVSSSSVSDYHRQFGIFGCLHL
jgi:hypothetical protein